MVKIVLVAIMVLFAYRSRGVVQRLVLWLAERRTAGTGPRAAEPDGSADEDWFDEPTERQFLRTNVLVETAVAVAVITVTALLVNAAPALTANQLGAQGATGITLKSATLWVDITAAPGRAGLNDMHVFALEPDGHPAQVQELTATIELPSHNIDPIQIPLRRITSDHGYSPGFDIPIAGTWRITAKAVLSEFDERTLTGRLVIR